MNSRRIAWLAACLFVVGSFVSPLAQAQERPLIEPGKHYVIEIQPRAMSYLAPGEEKAEVIDLDVPAEELAWERRVRVFDSYSDAIHAATEGWVRLPSDIHPADVTPDMLIGIGEASTTIIATDYDSTYFGGSSLVWVANNSLGCKTYSCGFLGLGTCWYHYYDSALGANWNDRISSTEGGPDAQCYRNVLWEDQNYAGSKRECNSSCSTLGVMDNAASSRKWCRSGDSFCN